MCIYPHWAIANFALLVWQGDTPDSGEAAIMGVPLPHLVLPLSGCLSRHTPTRATRGEARGHRSVLAQNSLLMYPLLFLPLDWSSARCVLARWWTGPHCLCAAVGTFLSGVVRSRYLVDMWVADGHTARLLWLCLRCVFIASRCGCRPASGMSTPSRCRALVHSQVSMVSRSSWAQWSCESVCVWQSRSSGPQWLSLRTGESW